MGRRVSLLEASAALLHSNQQPDLGPRDKASGWNRQLISNVENTKHTVAACASSVFHSPSVFSAWPNYKEKRKTAIIPVLL